MRQDTAPAVGNSCQVGKTIDEEERRPERGLVGLGGKGLGTGNPASASRSNGRYSSRTLVPS